MENKTECASPESLSFAVRLKKMRLRAELTQEQLSFRSGYSLGTIKSWETGRRTPSGILRLKQLFAALELTSKESDDMVMSILLVRLSDRASAADKFDRLSAGGTG